MKDTNYSVLGFAGYNLKSGSSSSIPNPAVIEDVFHFNGSLVVVYEKGTNYITFATIAPSFYSKIFLNFICMDNY